MQFKSGVTVLLVVLSVLVLYGCSVKNEKGTGGEDQTPVDIMQQTSDAGNVVTTKQEPGSLVDITQQASDPDQAFSDQTADGGYFGEGEEKILDEAAWVVYWDDEDYVKKLSEKSFDPQIICEFEAYFDGEYKILKEERVEDQFKALKALPEMADRKFYLTFVNDLVSEGQSSQKDTGLLYELLKDPERHAGDVIDAAKEDGYDGIEIDYEKIRDDLKLWDMFIAFEEELIKEAEKENLPLRIVLEPSTPVDKIDLPEGPEYVVMCYNLYGYGTEPGPKADRDFLIGLCEKFEPLSDNLGFAFANGGFDWNLTKGTIEPLTDLKGRELMKAFGKEADRDEKSKTLTFTYEKGQEKHEVYFADDKTLAFWAEVIYEQTGKKVRMNLWRI